MEAIYTLEVARDIMDLFEDVLDKYNIKVPSPDDDDREPGNDAKLYGTVYGDLLSEVEDVLIRMLGSTKTNIIEGVWYGGK